MSAGSTGTAAAPILCNGIEIKYKAFARFFTVGANEAELVLLASCYFPTPGFQIFFEPDGPSFKLMQNNPTGIVVQLVAFYATTWPPYPLEGLSQVPEFVTIVDAYGEHTVEVQRWT